MRKYLNNETGSMSIIVLGIVIFIVFLVVLFANFIKIFAVSDRGSTVADQASLAATAEIYEKTYEVVENYEYPCGPLVFCPLIVDYENVKAALQASETSLSDNELHRKAIDKLLLNKVPDDPNLWGLINNAIKSARSDFPTVVERIINKNMDENLDYEITLTSDYRIKIKITAKFHSEEGGMVGKITEDIVQEGYGVEIPFLQFFHP